MRKGQGNINLLVHKKIREYFGLGIAYSVQVTGWMTKESWFYFQRMQEVFLLWSVQTGREPTQLSIHWVTTEGMVMKLTTVLYPASLLPRAFMAHIRKNLPGNVMVTRFVDLYISKKQNVMNHHAVLMRPQIWTTWRIFTTFTWTLHHLGPHTRT